MGKELQLEYVRISRSNSWLYFRILLNSTCFFEEEIYDNEKELWKEGEAISQSNERYDPNGYTRMHRAIENKFLE